MALSDTADNWRRPCRDKRSRLDWGSYVRVASAATPSTLQLVGVFFCLCLCVDGLAFCSFALSDWGESSRVESGTSAANLSAQLTRKNRSPDTRYTNTCAVFGYPDKSSQGFGVFRCGRRQRRTTMSTPTPTATLRILFFWWRLRQCALSNHESMHTHIWAIHYNNICIHYQRPIVLYRSRMPSRQKQQHQHRRQCGYFASKWADMVETT